MKEEREDYAAEELLDEDFIEVDWEPLQAAIDALAEAGLDLADLEAVRDHLAVLLAALLRRLESTADYAEEELAEFAADTAALAVQIALGEEEVPELLSSGGED